jgi:hypothetical protein
MYLKDVDRVCGIAIYINGLFENLILKFVNFVLWFESQQKSYFGDFVDKNVVGLSLKDDSTLIDPLQPRKTVLSFECMTVRFDFCCHNDV